MYKIIKTEEGNYVLDLGDGSTMDCKVWIEKSKVSEKHPEGRPHILLPKDNPTNRRYIAEDLFNANAVNGELVVEVKTSGPRVLGSSGVSKNIVRYLNEEEAAEFTQLVESAQEAYRAAKASTRKKKPEEMTKEELEAFIHALETGESIKAATTGPRSFVDMFTEEENDRYNELVALSVENKANAPKPVRAKLTDEEKAARAIKRKQTTLNKAQQLLAALLAGNDNVTKDEDFGDEEIIDDIDM